MAYEIINGHLFPTHQETYTEIHVEASCCAWEHMIEKQMKTHEGWMCGAVNAREQAILMGPVICAIVAMAEDMKQDFHDGHAYDWEVVPAIVDMFQWTYHPASRGNALALPMTIREAAAKLIDMFGFEE